MRRCPQKGDGIPAYKENERKHLNKEKKTGLFGCFLLILCVLFCRILKHFISVSPFMPSGQDEGALYGQPGVPHLEDGHHRLHHLPAPGSGDIPHHGHLLLLPRLPWAATGVTRHTTTLSVANANRKHPSSTILSSPTVTQS